MYCDDKLWNQKNLYYLRNHVLHGDKYLQTKFCICTSLYTMKQYIQQLIDEFERWAADVGVIEWSVLLPRLYAFWGMDDIHG